MTLLIIEFFIFSFIGWVLDLLYNRLIDEHRWVSTGYFHIPICPIYGIGGILLIYIYKYFNFLPVFWLILVATFFMIATEYIGGKITERVLHLRLWDYRQSRFNIDGYIDLIHSFCWLLLAIIFYYFLFPKIIFLENIIKIPSLFDLPILLFTIIFFIVVLSKRSPDRFLEIKEKIINLSMREYSDLIRNYQASLKAKNSLRKEFLEKKIKYYLDKANVKIKGE